MDRQAPPRLSEAAELQAQTSTLHSAGQAAAKEAKERVQSILKDPEVQEAVTTTVRRGGGGRGGAGDCVVGLCMRFRDLPHCVRRDVSNPTKFFF